MSSTPNVPVQIIVAFQPALTSASSETNLTVKDPSNEDDKFKRVKIRNFLKQLGLEGLDRKKFFLTIKNLKFANENIEFYTKKNLEDNVTVLNKKNNLILKENFFFQSREVVFRSLTEVINLSSLSVLE